MYCTWRGIGRKGCQWIGLVLCIHSWGLVFHEGCISRRDVSQQGSLGPCDSLVNQLSAGYGEVRVLVVKPSVPMVRSDLLRALQWILRLGHALMRERLLSSA